MYTWLRLRFLYHSLNLTHPNLTKPNLNHPSLTGDHSNCVHILMKFGKHYIYYKLTAIAMIFIWSEWRLTVIAATVRIALVDILDLSEVDIPAARPSFWEFFASYSCTFMLRLTDKYQ